MYNYVFNARWLLRLTLVLGFTVIAAFSQGGVAKADCSVVPTTLQDTGTVFSYPDGFDLKGMAQSFTPSCSGTISQITVLAGYNNNGTPADVRVDIEGDSSGSPDGSSLANATSPYSNFPSDASAAAYTFTLNAPLSVVSGTTYWVVLTSPGNNSNLHYWFVKGSSIDTYGTVSTGNDTLTVWTSPPYNSTSALNLSMSVVSGGGGGTTTASTTVQQIDNANQDFFYGIFAFFAMFYGMIWLFRKRS